ncbi:MAG TPA: recombinase family protein [Bacteroidia bacterium]
MSRKAVRYIRTSTVEQTPEIQIKDIASLNPPIDSVIYSEQESAWKENVKRPEFEKLRANVINGSIGAIYVWSLDRIYRNRKRLIEFLALCKNYKVIIYSYNEQWLNAIQEMQPPWNEIVYDLMLQITGWTAESESKLKSNRVKMAVKRTDNGTYSYKGVRWGRKPMPKQTINKVIELHIQGKSVRQIAKEVMLYDKNNNGTNLSIGAVHKTIAQYRHEKDSKMLSS